MRAVGAVVCLFALLGAPTVLAGELDAHTVESGAKDLIEGALQDVREARRGAEDEASHTQQEADDDVREQKREARSFERDARKEATAAVGDASATVDAALTLAEDLVISPVQQASNELIASLDAPAEHAAQTEMAPQSAAVAPIAQASIAPLLWAAGAAATGGALLVWMAGSSTSAAEAARRVLPGASPLFTRFEKDTVLGHPKREQLYRLVMNTPGVTLQDLCESTNLSRTAVTHHMRLMEQQHLIVSKRVGRSRHFYENGGRYGREQKEAYAVLRNDRTQDVASFIAAHPGAIQKSICEALGIQASVAHWHVRRLAEAKLVEPVRQGRTVSYYLTGPLPA